MTPGRRRRSRFYGSTPAYRPVLDLHGWGELAGHAEHAVQAGRVGRDGRADRRRDAQHVRHRRRAGADRYRSCTAATAMSSSGSASTVPLRRIRCAGSRCSTTLKAGVTARELNRAERITSHSATIRVGHDTMGDVMATRDLDVRHPSGRAPRPVPAALPATGRHRHRPVGRCRGPAPLGAPAPRSARTGVTSWRPSARTGCGTASRDGCSIMRSRMPPAGTPRAQRSGCG